MTEVSFLPGVPEAHVVSRLAAAGGKEIESGKLASPQSSAALAVNTFGWFVERPAMLPPFPRIADQGPPALVDVEYCARFPWAGGRHPWLDAVVETEHSLIGVESKRFEPYRDRKNVTLSAAYDRPVWGPQMKPYESMRDALRKATEQFVFLDAAQLVKHAFGLVTDARRKRKSPTLLYLFAEPKELDGRTLQPAAFRQHRKEIARFSGAVANAEVTFAAISYREWLDTWPVSGPVAEHARAVLETFDP